MKIQIPLSKLLDSTLSSTLHRVMEKWTEAKDIHVLVKIAQAIEAETKSAMETVKRLTDQHGFELEAGRKSVNAEEITHHILQKCGKVLPDGKMTMAGASDDEMDSFREFKKDADAALRQFNQAAEAALSELVEIDIPRLIKVSEKMVRKQAINAKECLILSPILDLFALSGDEDADSSGTAEDD